VNELKILADAKRWYLAEKRDDPRIPDMYTDEGQARLKVLCVYQASMEPDFNDDAFGSKLTKMLDDLRPLGAGPEWSLAHGWHDPKDKSLLQLPLWQPYYESFYRDMCRDLTRLKREGFTERADRAERVLSAIEEAFPEMVKHMIQHAGVRRP
jgi:hypothetical protein